jgi:hypothetical protein
LGFGFYDRGSGVKTRVDAKARQRAEDRVRRLAARNWGVSMEQRIRQLNSFTVGWTAYFAFAETPYLGSARIQRGRKLRALGLSEADARATAASQKGYWHLAGTYPLQRAMPNAYWHRTLG